MRTDGSGDFSTYTLSIVANGPAAAVRPRAAAFRPALADSSHDSISPPFSPCRSRTTRPGGRRARCSLSTRAARRHASARSSARSVSSRKRGPRGAIFSRAAEPTRTSSSRSRMTAARGCASAMTTRASGPSPTRNSRSPRRAMSAPRRSRISSARRAGPSRRCAIRCRRPAASSPENIEAARRDAPQAFRTQERAVTPADYAAAAERRPEVQHAAATFRWTGSWYTVFVTPDRFGGGDIDARFATRLRRHLERFRMAGYDLEVRAPRYVPLDVDAAHLRAAGLFPRAGGAGGAAGPVRAMCCPTAGSACSIPTISPSATRFTSAASSPPRRPSRASMRFVPNGSSASSIRAQPRSRTG